MVSAFTVALSPMKAVVCVFTTLTPAEIATPAVPPAMLIVNVEMSSRFVAVTATPRKPDCVPGVSVRLPDSAGSLASVLPSWLPSIMASAGVLISP